MKPKVAENIKRLRKRRGWTQRDLAEATGSTLSHINKIETGKYSPSMEALIKLSEALGVSMDELASGGMPEAELEGKSSAQLARIIDSLDPEDRGIILRMLRTMLINKRFMSLASENSDPLSGMDSGPVPKRRLGAQ